MICGGAGRRAKAAAASRARRPPRQDISLNKAITFVRVCIAAFKGLLVFVLPFAAEKAAAAAARTAQQQTAARSKSQHHSTAPSRLSLNSW